VNEKLQAVAVKGYEPYFPPPVVFGYTEDEVERFEAIEKFLVYNEGGVK
jgi:hypothetical protein